MFNNSHIKHIPSLFHKYTDYGSLWFNNVLDIYKSKIVT